MDKQTKDKNIIFGAVVLFFLIVVGMVGLVIYKNKQKEQTPEVFLTEGEASGLDLELPPVSTPTLPSQRTGLTGHWKFDEGGGLVAHDSSGNNNHGAIKNSTWTEGKLGKALNFNNENSYVMVKKQEALNIGTNDFTLSAWVKLDPTVTQKYPTIIASGGGSDENPGYYLFYHQAKKKLRFTIGDGISRVHLYSKSDIRDGNWHHVAVVGDRDKILILYIDGKANSSTSEITSKKGKNIAPNYNFFIGSYHKIHNWKGGLDEVRIYRQALSATKIRSLVSDPTSVRGVSTELNLWEKISRFIFR